MNMTTPERCTEPEAGKNAGGILKQFGAINPVAVNASAVNPSAVKQCQQAQLRGSFSEYIL